MMPSRPEGGAASNSHAFPGNDKWPAGPLGGAASATAEAPWLLLADDSEVFRDRMARALCDRGYLVATASSADEALAIARTRPFSLALLDLKMPGRSGLSLLRELRELSPNIRVVILTGFGSIASAVEAMRLGAVNFIPKPADADDVLAAFAIGVPAGTPADRGEGAESREAPEPEAPSLARAEWEHIQRILSDCGGNISEAARRLGIHRRSLQRKLQKLAP